MLVEKNNSLASEASGNSLRIIHGGLRYFQTLNISRTFHSVLAQKDLVERYQKFISKLPCTLLLPRSLIIPSYLLASIYNLTSLFLTGSKNGAFVSNDLPFGLSKRFTHGLVWNDAIINDLQGLVTAIRSEINGKILLETKALAFQDPNTLLTNKGELKADIWVLMAGPLCELSSRSEFCYGWNLIFKGNYHCALGVKSKRRFLFSVSRDGEIAAGTWYTKNYPSEFEIKAAKKEIRTLLPELNLDEFLRVEVGCLPGLTPTDKIELIKHKTHLEVITPKLTTCFYQAKLVLDSISSYQT